MLDRLCLQSLSELRIPRASAEGVCQYAVYAPLIEHITLAIHLESYNLGSDDELPEHAILCDTVRHKMYVGAYKEIDYFLLQQHPHEPSQLTAQEFEEAVKAMESMTLEQMQRLGMFEMFGNTNPQARQATAELVQWLDQQITEELIQQYIQLANRGNWTAVKALDILKRRILETRKYHQQLESN